MLRRILFTATALLALSSGVLHVHAASGADLAVTMAANTPSAQVGQDITYTIVATNNGPATVSDYYIRDILPSNLAIVGENCGGPSADGTWCEYANPSWSLAQGQSITMTLVARVTAASPTPTVNEGCAGIFGGATDPNSSNNCASVSVSIVSQDAGHVSCKPNRPSRLCVVRAGMASTAHTATVLCKELSPRTRCWGEPAVHQAQ